MDVKTSILQAGKTLLTEQGIAAVTQLKVAKAAGVKQSHLTYYFPRRSDLLLGIAAYVVEAIMAALADKLVATPADDTFVAVLDEMMVSGIPTRIMIGLIVAADEEPGLRPELVKLIRSVRSRLVALFEQAGIADSDNAALLLHATVVGLSVMHLAEQSSASAQETHLGIESMLNLIGLKNSKS